MKPYYILEVCNFDTTKNKFYSNYQNIKIPTDISNNGLTSITGYGPQSYFEKQENKKINNLIEYHLTMEIENKKKCRIVGINQEDYFDSFITVSEDKLYYSKLNEIIILLSGKNIFNKFKKEFKNNEDLQFKEVQVNFDEIIKNKDNLGITSVYLGNLPQNARVQTIGIWGDKIESTEQFLTFKRQGAEIKNISIIYNYKNTSYLIMLTRLGGVILYDHLDNSKSLAIVEDVYTKILS